MSAHVAIDEIAPMPPSPTIKDLNDGRFHLKPLCSHCSSSRAAMALDQDQGPRLRTVERVTIIRDLSRGYLIVAHCHGASEEILMGQNTPTDREIQTTKAFAHGRKENISRKENDVTISGVGPRAEAGRR